jgi:4-aminobutyrate aminotransferase-like enzyme
VVKVSAVGDYTFARDPVAVPPVESAYRRIGTPIPAPSWGAVHDLLDKYEARSMHGQLPVVWDAASGFQVGDADGNRWIDFTSTIFVANVGHAHPRVKAALVETIDRDLLHSYTYATEIRARYLERLIEFTPPPLEKAFLLSAGTEATECALKLTRLHGRRAGKRSLGVLSFVGSMHGRTLGAEMLTRDSEWIGYSDPNIHRLPFPYPWTLEGRSGREQLERDLAELADRGVDLAQDICGAILETYIGWSASFFPVDYVQGLAELAREHGFLMVADDIQAGFGRTGRLFGYEHYGIEPDLVCCGKGIASGFPLAAVLGRREVLDLPAIGSMSSTHSANPLACAAGLATIDVLEDENLIAESERKGELLFERLRALQARFPDSISHVLGRGLLAALIVTHRDGSPDGDTASRIAECAMQKGLLVVHTGRESIKLGPPLSIPDDALFEGADVLAEAFAEIVG